VEYLKRLLSNYKLKQGIWELINYTCMDCGRQVSIKISETHYLICKRINTLTKSKDVEMPIQVITIKGERYYRYGDSGKPYKNRQDAEKQAAAIHAAGYKEPQQKMQDMKDMTKK
jgi:DNA-directed RNA polymerase subunit RPC12/RpoP